MALTLEAEQRMEGVGLIAFYQRDHTQWLATIRDTRRFVAEKFPSGARIRRDDVAKTLIPILEVHEDFNEYRERQKLRGKFWIKDFADLLIDRTWDHLDGN
jgi:hypothetical protein